MLNAREEEEEDVDGFTKNEIVRACRLYYVICALLLFLRVLETSLSEKRKKNTCPK